MSAGKEKPVTHFNKLLKFLLILRTDDCATAHHEHEAQRNANGHRVKLPICVSRLF